MPEDGGPCAAHLRGDSHLARPRGAKAMTSRHCEIPARLDQFGKIASAIDEFARVARLSNADCHKLTLIAEELFTNTVRHGHRGDSESPVSVYLESADDGMRMVYEDTAPPYDSLAAASSTDIESTVNNLKVGGLGVALTFALAKTANYAYVGGRNRIVIELPKTR
jgi:anti-sigma regulatory factor (Ser/Thr protein kinase)